MIRIALALVGALAVATPVVADDAADIEARITGFEEAFNAGDAARVAAFYTEDAIALPPGGPMIEGREAIREMWQGAMDSGFKDLDLKPREIEVAGDTAFETSTFSAMVAGEDGETPAPGKYVVVWKKVDGQWLLHRDIWNSMPEQ